MRILTTRQEREKGALALFFAILAPVMLSAGMLIWDASIKIEAHSRAQSTAQEAARAGAQAVSADAITGNVAGADPAAAAAAAQNYLAAAGENGTATVNADTVTVTVSKPWSGELILGGGVTTATASARVASAP